MQPEAECSCPGKRRTSQESFIDYLSVNDTLKELQQTIFPT